MWFWVSDPLCTRISYLRNRIRIISGSLMLLLVCESLRFYSTAWVVERAPFWNQSRFPNNLTFNGLEMSLLIINGVIMFIMKSSCIHSINVYWPPMLESWDEQSRQHPCPQRVFLFYYFLIAVRNYFKLNEWLKQHKFMSTVLEDKVWNGSHWDKVKVHLVCLMFVTVALRLCIFSNSVVKPEKWGVLLGVPRSG